MECHEFQREACEAAQLPILNAACKEDPAQLGADFGAVNLDICEYDPHTKTDMRKLPGFVHGSVLKIPFEDGHFNTVVLGEFLEHCEHPVAMQALEECTRVLNYGGKLIITYPKDPRPKEGQHPEELLIEWSPGITSWHQTVWPEEEVCANLKKLGYRVEKVEEIPYGPILDYCEGVGIVAVKTIAL